MKGEKAAHAAERERLHSEIVQAMTALTAHVSNVQTRLGEGAQLLADKKAQLMEAL